MVKLGVAEAEGSMRSIAMAGVFAAALGGCAQQQAADQPDGSAVLAAFGTPFLIVAKIPVCVLTVVVAAPVGAVSEISDPATPFGHDIRQGLADGIASNCGPPFAVTP
jgi:hypothetical protein